MIEAIVVRLPFTSRPVALPVLAKLVIKRTNSASRLWLACRVAQMLARALPGRRIHVAADSAHAREELKKPPEQVTWTTRLRKDAALHDLPPTAPGGGAAPRPGRRLPSLADLAATAASAPVTATRYGKTAAVQAAASTCPWYGVFGTRQVTVILIRDAGTTGYDLALVATDLGASPAQLIERYAARWSIEVRDRRRQATLGRRPGPQPHRRRGPPHRPVPARLPGPGHDLVCHRRPPPADVGDHRNRAPWYHSKAQPPAAGMLAKPRRVFIAARFRASRPDQPAHGEMNVIRLAWDDAAA